MAGARDLALSYDGGIIMGGQVGEGYGEYAWIKKVDINGEPLWEKRFSEDHTVLLFDLKEDQQGNLFFSGGVVSEDRMEDIMVLKLNACGELCWGKIFHTHEDGDFGMYLEITENGDCIASSLHHKENRVTLFRFDGKTGDVKWINDLTPPEGSGLFDEIVRSLNWISNNKLLVSGRVYDESEEGVGYLKGLNVVCNAKTGAVEHMQALDQGIFEGTYWIHDIFSCELSPCGNYFYNGIFQSSLPDNNAALVKCDLTGTELTRKSLWNPQDESALYKFKFVDEANMIGCLRLVFEKEEKDNNPCMQVEDSKQYSPKLFFARSENQEEENKDGAHAILFDTTGNIQKIQRLSILPHWMEKTPDNKYYFFTRGGYGEEGDYTPDAILWKFNEHLEYDSIYTQPREYDYLCDREYNTEDIDPSELEVVGLNELLKQSYEPLQIYPNPAVNYVRISLPKGVHSQQKQAGLLVNTHNYDYLKQSKIEVIDQLGKVIYRESLNTNQTELKLSTTDFTKGIYLIRLLHHEEIKASSKLIVQ